MQNDDQWTSGRYVGETSEKPFQVNRKEYNPKRPTKSMWILASLFLASAIFVFFYSEWRSRGLPPGPRGLPLLGYLPWLDPKNPHLTFTDLAKKHGGIYSVQLGNIFTVVLSDAGIIREAFALNEFSGRAPLFLTHGIMDGNGIICAQGDKWKEQRKFVTNNLRNFGMVKFGQKRCKMESAIRKGVDDATEKFGRTSDPMDPEPVLMHALGNVVFDLVFGRTWKEEDETWKRLLSYQEEGTKLIGVAGPINFLPVLRFLPKYKKILQYIKNGIIYTHRIYEQILDEYKAMEEESEPSHFLGAFEKEMRSRGQRPGYYTLSQFNFLMADLWGAGVDTTITTLRWFFLFMATYNKLQEEIQEEMDQVLGPRKLSLTDFPDLPLLQASISETQRIRSVTPLGFPHGALQDGFLAGYRIPKGTMLIPLQWAVHMNPSLHSQPEEYNPARFLDEDGKYKKSEAFLPFQTGKRMCLGEELAKMLLFLFGGGILQNFTLSLVEGREISLEGDVGITLTPKRHKIRFFPRRKGGRQRSETPAETVPNVNGE